MCQVGTSTVIKIIANYVIQVFSITYQHRLGNHSCAQELILGESQLYHRQPNTTMVVPKGINKQAIVFVVVNGGDSVPSVFALSRTSVASAIMEGSVKTTDIEIDSNGDLLLSGMSARHMYARIFLME